MTREVFQEHIDQSILRAERHQSWIDESVLSLGGFSTGVMRRLFSNLVHLPKGDPAYLECGLFKGATFCAAINNSPTLHAYGVEDFSQNFGEFNVGTEMATNVEKYRDDARSVTIIDGDCFLLDLALIKHPIDVFFYDAVHSYEAQRDALPKFLSAMADLFCMVVDDYSWIPVREGTWDGLTQSPVEIVKEWHLGNGTPDDLVWHNDVAIFLCAKR